VTFGLAFPAFLLLPWVRRIKEAAGRTERHAA
jgi:hypothetical protein